MDTSKNQGNTLMFFITLICFFYGAFQTYTVYNLSKRLEEQININKRLLEEKFIQPIPTSPSPIKPKMDDTFVNKKTKVVPKKVKIVKTITYVKPTYKEYTPVITNESILNTKMLELNTRLDNSLYQDFQEWYIQEGVRLANEEELLVKNLNENLSVLLNVVHDDTIKEEAKETKMQKVLKTSAKYALPLALTLIIP